MSEKILAPSAKEIEASVLGTALIIPELLPVIVGELSSDNFYDTGHRMLFEQMNEMHRNGRTVDMVTLQTRLEETGDLERIGGVRMLSDLTRNMASETKIEEYCRILREYGAKRKIIEYGSGWINGAYENKDVYDIISNAEEGLSEIHDLCLISEDSDVASLSRPVFDEIRSRRESEGVTGINTGLKRLNEITSGWQNSDLIIIAARPSMGKTALMLELAEHAATEGVAVGVMSLEMSARQLVQRFQIQRSGVDGDRVRRGRLNGDEVDRLFEAAGYFEQMNIPIDDTPSLSISEISARARRWAREHNIGLLVVDYLQLARADLQGNSNREQEISAISRGLKAVAKTLNIPVIALSQLSRSVETRGGDKRPMLSDLRESGSLEQDADVVMFLYRAEYYGIKTDENGDATDGVAELDVAKQRNGPVETARVHFDKSTMRFLDLTRMPEAPVSDEPFFPGT